MHILEDFHAFLGSAPTSWHAVREIGSRLALCDYIPLEVDEKWELKRGKKYFVAHGGSIAAFALPKSALQKALLIGAHTDSPALKIKPQPEIHKENMTLLGVEVYGGPILPSWLSRDLGIAGRVFVLNAKQQIEEHLIFIDDTPLFIPFLAPHLDRESGEKGLLLNKQDHMIPLATLKQNENQKLIESMLHCHFSFHTLLSFDLFLVPLEEPRFIGNSSEMIASYRLDNLASVHAGVTALGNLSEASEHTLQMGLFWDHEEIGSQTAVGAESPFFSDIFDRISHFYSLDPEEKAIVKNRSLCLSVDVAHALNPNYEKKYDPQHLPLLGKGVVIKSHAGQRYASSAAGTAQVIHLCQQQNIPYQQYVSRSDIPSGSTIGPVFAGATGIETVDIGSAQLAMHATRELISCQDHLDLATLLTHFLEEGE